MRETNEAPPPLQLPSEEYLGIALEKLKEEAPLCRRRRRCDSATKRRAFSNEAHYITNANDAIKRAANNKDTLWARQLLPPQPKPPP